jgi:hypothetical protein
MMNIRSISKKKDTTLRKKSGDAAQFKLASGSNRVRMRAGFNETMPDLLKQRAATVSTGKAVFPVKKLPQTVGKRSRPQRLKHLAVLRESRQVKYATSQFGFMHGIPPTLATPPPR